MRSWQPWGLWTAQFPQPGAEEEAGAALDARDGGGGVGRDLRGVAPALAAMPPDDASFAGGGAAFAAVMPQLQLAGLPQNLVDAVAHGYGHYPTHAAVVLRRKSV